MKLALLIGAGLIVGYYGWRYLKPTALQSNGNALDPSAPPEIESKAGVTGSVADKAARAASL